jgi:hypothetical protein
MVRVTAPLADSAATARGSLRRVCARIVEGAPVWRARGAGIGQVGACRRSRSRLGRRPFVYSRVPDEVESFGQLRRAPRREGRTSCPELNWDVMAEVTAASRPPIRRQPSPFDWICRMILVNSTGPGRGRICCQSASTGELRVPEDWDVDAVVTSFRGGVHRQDTAGVSALPWFHPRSDAFLQIRDDAIGHALVQSGDVHVLLLAAGIREFGCRGARGRSPEIIYPRRKDDQHRGGVGKIEMLRRVD